MAEDMRGAIHQTNPPMMAIGPMLQCHLCMDMVDLGIIDSEEAHPAVVVYPTKGSLCEWHRLKVTFNNIRLGPGEGRERYRQPLIEEGFLPAPRTFKSVSEFVTYMADHGEWTPNDDAKAEARETVLEHIVTTAHDLAGTVEQVREGLIELAEKDYGDCRHPAGGPTPPDRCVRCTARRFLVLLDSSEGERYVTGTNATWTKGDGG